MMLVATALVAVTALRYASAHDVWTAKDAKKTRKGDDVHRNRVAISMTHLSWV